jgi:hypothetical protein
MGAEGRLADGRSDRMRQRRRGTGHGGRTRPGVMAGNANGIHRRQQHGVGALRAGATAQTRLAAVGSVFSRRWCGRRHGCRGCVVRRGLRVACMAWHVYRRRGFTGPRSLGIDRIRHLHGYRCRGHAIDGEHQAQQHAQQERPDRHARILPPDPARVAGTGKRHRTAAHNATVKSIWLVGGRTVTAAAWPDRFAVCGRCTLV